MPFGRRKEAGGVADRRAEAGARAAAVAGVAYPAALLLLAAAAGIHARFALVPAMSSVAPPERWPGLAGALARAAGAA